ncbi:Isopenicillin N epimerase component 2 [Taenia crassiceps]|uniref:Isopenicillin N epimerase component 2 n=1 Tax=Taenia crassiceps TaxID=6207 RepID=A0ABR4QRJ3_9CEST
MCGLILKDYGASVHRILNPNAPFSDHLLSPGKPSLSLDLKVPSDRRKLLDLCKSADVLLDPYRPKCLDRLGLAPDVLHKANKRLILTRISGYGQPESNKNIDYYLRPGHDINYLAESGILWLFIGERGKSVYPINIIADIAGGAFPAVAGILLALYEREKSGLGKIVDVSITDGISYVSTYFMASCQLDSRNEFNALSSLMHWHSLARQCANLLDGGAPFYRIYETKDNKFVAVGALEPHFYANLLRPLGLTEKYAPQLDRHAWPRIAAILSGIFPALLETRVASVFAYLDPVPSSLTFQLTRRKMTLMGAFGCGLIGFGPTGILFCLVVARDPLQVIFFTLSAFLWLIGLLTASVIWYAAVPLRDQLAFGLVIVCLLQEIMRFLFYFLVSKAEYNLQKMVEAEAQDAIHLSPPGELDVAVRSTSDCAKFGSIFDLRTLAFTSGLSFGLMGSIVEYVYIFYGVIGPGTLLKGSNPGYFFIFAGLNTFFMGLLQVSWSIILFRAFRLRLYIDIVIVYAIHVALSALTLLNNLPHPAPELVCVTFMIAALGFNTYAFFAAGGRLSLGASSPLRSTNSPGFLASSAATATPIN